MRIRAEGVGKRLRRYHRDRTTTVPEMLIQAAGQKQAAGFFWALRDVSFAVGAGEALGLVGANGAGKSTLVRLIGGIGRPTEGRIAVRGAVNSLLELGCGFHHDLTGRENVFINGVIAGLTRRDVRRRFDDIVAFAELEGAIDAPLRTYSSGMQMRLAFAIAVHSPHDVLLIDEALAVGDVAFQKKCVDRIARFKAEGSALVIVSHDAALVQEMCDQVLWLRQGRVAGYGPAEETVSAYLRSMVGESIAGAAAGAGPGALPDERGIGDHHDIEITGVRLGDAHGGVSMARPGGPLTVEIAYRAHRRVRKPNFLVSLRDYRNQVVSTLFTGVDDTPDIVAEGRGVAVAGIDRLDLAGGTYYVDAGIYDSDWTAAYDYSHRAGKVEIGARQEREGMLLPPVRWEVRAASDAAQALTGGGRAP